MQDEIDIHAGKLNFCARERAAYCGETHVPDNIQIDQAAGESWGKTQQ